MGALRLARLLPGWTGKPQATGVASRAVRWVERSEVRTSGPTRSRDFGEDKVGSRRSERVQRKLAFYAEPPGGKQRSS